MPRTIDNSSGMQAIPAGARQRPGPRTKALSQGVQICQCTRLHVDAQCPSHLLLFWIEQRCREIFPRSWEHYFGGLCVPCWGLLPASILRRPLFTNILQKPRDIQAKAFYTTFGQTIELDTVMRQRSDDASVRFRKMFERPREERLARTMSF
ncbi:hypothetical protein PENFLA_c071G00631 [Penicillium flavigenum]|uniref:Uncharacterized protein n=1 Tax=Penicillium flavigenum TaxID=254877 RepID=A0A1V6SDT9_9EURO|nr:hypothetical protein PENFLA_c071G00631 [Penicillium flavigenum]